LAFEVTDISIRDTYSAIRSVISQAHARRGKTTIPIATADVTAAGGRDKNVVVPHKWLHPIAALSAEVV
jgi:hypothetical protein